MSSPDFTGPGPPHRTRHLVGVSFCDSRARAGDRAARAAERRPRNQVTALAHPH
ncbi:hypothetical protein [Streptomyces sp. NPDC006610]|uniref:hypothetical protein n=1 Tax=Streptomyces sp. NPDC006610 TaxID=3154584 RepID=UPI0033A3CC9A